jgi:acyl-CoA reductase-like NAD-dependent aldehyde dehydrogenase
MDFFTDYTLIIDGKPFATAARMDVINPATGTAFATAPVAREKELNAAVDAARAAQPAWRARGIARRRELLISWSSHHGACRRVHPVIRERARPSRGDGKA